MEFTDQEDIALSICAEGGTLLAIGSWEAPVTSLFGKGLLAKYGDLYYITKAGELAYGGMADVEIRALIDEHNQRMAADGIVVDGEICPSL